MTKFFLIFLFFNSLQIVGQVIDLKFEQNVIYKYDGDSIQFSCSTQYPELILAKNLRNNKLHLSYKGNVTNLRLNKSNEINYNKIEFQKKAPELKSKVSIVKLKNKVWINGYKCKVFRCNVNGFVYDIHLAKRKKLNNTYIVKYIIGVPFDEFKLKGLVVKISRQYNPDNSTLNFLELCFVSKAFTNLLVDLDKIENCLNSKKNKAENKLPSETLQEIVE